MHQCIRYEDLPEGVSKGISDFHHFANFRDKCLISNEIELRYIARVNDDARNNSDNLRAIKFAIKNLMISECGVDRQSNKCEKIMCNNNK